LIIVTDSLVKETERKQKKEGKGEEEEKTSGIVVYMIITK